MTNIYGNTPCMLGAANLSKTKDYSQVDAIIYGIPWEGAVTWGDYTGCELGKSDAPMLRTLFWLSTRTK